MGRKKQLPKFLEPEEREKLLKQPNPRYPTGERNLLVLRLMLRLLLQIQQKALADDFSAL